MSEAPFIKRKNKDAVNRYQKLKEQGFAAVQQLSGDQWTDFNTHDPGVTVLESLCYGISDLVYRSEFSVADLLARDEKGIDYQASALHMPEQAFSSRATTAEDYRKLILDQICDVDDAWVIPCDSDETDGVVGLYRILLQLSQAGNCLSCDEIVQQVKAIFYANRNLGEDLFSVSEVEAVNCTLHAEIEIESLIQPSDLLASTVPP